MLFASSRSKSRIRRRRSAVIRLEALEDRLPPGDILFGLALGSVSLRPGNVFGDQRMVTMQESAVPGSGDLSVLPAWDETLPLRPRHVARLTDTESATSALPQGVPGLAFAGFDLAPGETRGRLLSAKEEGPVTVSWLGPVIGMPWANHGTASGALRVVDLPVVQAGASIPGNEVNDQLPLAFDRAGVLHIRADGADQTISETVTPAGFVEVTVAGQRHSADPASDSFDAALAGATSSTLAGLWLESGGARETLILGSQQLAGGLLVHAGDAQVTSQDVSVGGPLAIQGSNITVGGSLHSTAVTLAASGLISVEAPTRVTAEQITVAADIFVNAGQIHADGAVGGRVEIQSRNVLNAGPITADGVSGDGGQVGIAFTGSYVGTVAGLTSANGGQGGSVRIDGGSTGRLYSSGSHVAIGARGGRVDLLGREVILPSATVDASGQNAGGTIRIGGDFHGHNPEIADAQTVTVTPATMIRANATGSGNGGRVAIWSDGETDFSGSIAAHGGPAGGDGGFIEASGKGNLNYGGPADAGARLGRTGTLLLDPKNINISEAPAGLFPQFDLIDPHPTQGGFGSEVTVVDSGNVVVTNPNDDFGAPRAGAAYLFNGLTGALISSLVGSNPGDQVGYVPYPSGVFGITLLSNGTYLIGSVNWNSRRGAVTWASGHTGVSGILSEANSLVGSNVNDYVGYGVYGYDGVTPLANGNYLVKSPSWNARRGAVTFGNGTTGIRGIVSAANSLVGSNSYDDVGRDGIRLLPNGNYLVRSHYWNSYRGAVTWGDASTGVRGVVSETNSLIGSHPNDVLGIYTAILLSNGNFVINNPYWNGSRGAATWGDASTGVHGIVSEDNSLVGTNSFDQVGYGVTPLVNGNYVVLTRYWNNSRGAATWGDGLTGIRGVVSESNSLIGSDRNDGIGSGAIALSNGNYVAVSTSWKGNRGAVTWGDGLMGTNGTVSEANSLVGSDPGDFVGTVIPLTNGNYLVRSEYWNGRRGAVAWGDGRRGVRGQVSEANSLVGTNPNDFVGYNIPIPLSNGNYVVVSPDWYSNRGAVTWGEGSTGVRGPVSEINSLVGTSALDRVGEDGIARLQNGNFVVASSFWHGAQGAATWGDGTIGIHGSVSEVNSLVGTHANDRVGRAVTPVANGNYVVGSGSWNGGRGALTWGDGSLGVRGPVSETNSLVGSSPGDAVGGPVTVLTNGNYVVRSGYGTRGAVTWVDGSTGVTGTVSEANSLVGTSPNDFVGSSGVIPLTNGNYLVRSGSWNNIRGAVTWGDGHMGVSGPVSEANSLVGSNYLDQVGFFVTLLGNGNYVVLSEFWNGSRGALTWGDAAAGVRGAVSEANSLVGSNRGDMVGQGLTPLSDGNYLAHTPGWNSNRGAVTWVNGTTGQTLDDADVITPQNSLLGQAANAHLGRIARDPVHHSFLAPFAAEGSGRVAIGVVDPNQFDYSRGQAQTVTLTPEFLTATLNAGTAVVLQASNDITINSPIIVNAGGHGGALTLQAGRSIVLNAGIDTDNGNLTLIANDRLANGVVDSQRDPGNAFITMALGTSLNTGTGALTVDLRDGAGLTHRDSGAVSLTDITAGSASIVNNGPSAGSDTRVGAVTTGGSQSYADPNGTTQVFGNLTAEDNPITFYNSVVVNSGLTIDAGAAFVTFAGSGVQLFTAGSGARFGNVSHTGTGSLRLSNGLTVTGQLTNTAGTFDANDHAVTVFRLTSVTGGTYLAGTAPQAFAGGLLVAGGVFTSSSGPMTVAGPVAVTDGLLGGEGTLDSITAVGGIVAPGSATSSGILAIRGSVSLFSSTTLRFRLNGPTPGTEYSQLVASGSVLLSNSTLSLTLGFEPAVGTGFEIFTTKAGPITGTFAGLDEGAIFSQGDYQFQITYQGGSNGTSVVVTRVK